MKIFEYFVEVVEANDNPYTLVSHQTFKENEQLKTVVNKRLIKLYLSSHNTFFSDLYFLLKKSNQSEVVDFYPKNIFQKIFKKKNLNSLLNIESLEDCNYLITSPKISKLIKTNCEVIIENDLDNEIIIGNKNSTLYLRKIDDEFEFSVDFEDFKIYQIK